MLFNRILASSLLLAAALVEAHPHPSKTTNVQLDEVLQEECDGLSKYRLGSWDCTVGDRTMMILTDEFHNRMRIMTTVKQVTEEEDLQAMLEANFDRALDAKYAIHNGQILSLYMHTLAELDLEVFKNAIAQVTTLADNYGTSYASSGLSFVGRSSPNNIQKTYKEEVDEEEEVEDVEFAEGGDELFDESGEEEVMEEDEVEGARIEIEN